MKTSEQIDQVSTALSLAQGEFPAIEKTRINPHFKSKFANISDILSACVPVLSKHGLTFCQGLSFTDNRLVVTTRVMHKSGQWIESELAIKPAKDDAQALGSASTYGRRYSAEAILGVSATDDDDGNAATGHKQDKEESKYTGTQEQQIRLKQFLAELGFKPATDLVIGEIHRALIGVPENQIRDTVIRLIKGREAK